MSTCLFWAIGSATTSTSNSGSAAVCLPARAPQKLSASICERAPFPTTLVVSFPPSTPHLTASPGARESQIYNALWSPIAYIALVPWSPRPQLNKKDNHASGHREKKRGDGTEFAVPTTIFLGSMPFNVACDLATTSMFRRRLLTRFSLNVICNMAESMGFPES